MRRMPVTKRVAWGGGSIACSSENVQPFRQFLYVNVFQVWPLTSEKCSTVFQNLGRARPAIRGSHTFAMALKRSVLGEMAKLLCRLLVLAGERPAC